MCRFCSVDASHGALVSTSLVCLRFSQSHVYGIYTTVTAMSTCIIYIGQRTAWVAVAYVQCAVLSRLCVTVCLTKWMEPYCCRWRPHMGVDVMVEGEKMFVVGNKMFSVQVIKLSFYIVNISAVAT